MSAAPETISVLPVALQLSEEQGLPGFPCGPDKQPLTEHGFKEATTNLEQIADWWTRWPAALLAVPTGAASKLIVVDIDPDGAGWYREHAERLGCARVHQTRRGHHLLYRMPAGIEIRNSAGKIAKGVDVRGEGGYIIWWPAHGFAAVGDLEELTEPPTWLLEQLTRSEIVPGTEKKLKKAAQVAATFPTDDTGKVSEGKRNDRLSREAFRLRKQGMEPPQILDMLRTLNGLICEPPLDDGELEAIAEGKKRVLPDTVTADDFYAYMPQHSYIFVPNRELWPASSVNARIHMTGTKASEWLDQHRAVEQMTWMPGAPMVIENRLISGGGWIERPGCRTFNLYIPPPELQGDASKAGPWLDHIARVYPEDARHIVLWLAQRVQRPGEKINHALLLGGVPGIGKDSLIEPVKYAVGAWNVWEVSPTQLLGRFNPFVKSVILRISEARDLGDVDRYALTEHLKVYEAAPPDVLSCDEKNLREHAVPNVTGVLITTNHPDAIYLAPDDRRHYVAWSERSKEEFLEGYWRDLYGWYQSGGIGHVAAYLATLDLSTFDPKAPPPKTAAFWRMVDAGRAPEDAELADVIDALGSPAAVTVSMLCHYASEPFREWLRDRRNSRQIPHRMEACEYVPVRNDARQTGLWVVGGNRQVIYAKRQLSIRDRIAAASHLCRESRQ